MYKMKISRRYSRMIDINLMQAQDLRKNMLDTETIIFFVSSFMLIGMLSVMFLIPEATQFDMEYHLSAAKAGDQQVFSR